MRKKNYKEIFTVDGVTYRQDNLFSPLPQPTTQTQANTPATKSKPSAPVKKAPTPLTSKQKKIFRIGYEDALIYLYIFDRLVTSELEKQNVPPEILSKVEWAKKRKQDYERYLGKRKPQTKLVDYAEAVVDATMENNQGELSELYERATSASYTTDLLRVYQHSRGILERVTRALQNSRTGK